MYAYEEYAQNQPVMRSFIPVFSGTGFVIGMTKRLVRVTVCRVGVTDSVLVAVTNSGVKSMN